MLGLLFGGMFAAAARRESADPGDAAAQSSGSGDSAGGDVAPPIVPLVGLPSGQDLLINPAVFGQIAGDTGTENYETSVYNDSSTQEQNYAAYDAVMSAGETAPVYSNDEPDISEPEINPASFHAMNPDWSFGDGGIADNPYTTSLVEKYYGDQLTTEQLEAIVQAATHYAMYGDASQFSSYEEMVRAAVDFAINNGMDANGEFPVQYEPSPNGDQSGNIHNADYNPDTDQGYYQDTANSYRPNSAAQRALKAFQEAERNKEAARQAWLKNPLTPTFSTVALTQTVLKITTLDIKNVPDSKFSKKVEKANADRAGQSYSVAQKAIKKDFITLVESLKEIIKENRDKMLPDDLNKLRSFVTQRIVNEMKGRIKYSANPGDPFNYLQFDEQTGDFLAPLKMDCSGFTTCVMHVMGDSPENVPYAQNQSGYKFRDKYVAQSTIQNGPSNQGNNTDLFNHKTMITKENINDMINKNDVAGLKKLEGKYFFWNYDENNTYVQHPNFNTYTHTGIIAGYNETTKRLIIYDCNRATATSPEAFKIREINVDVFKHFDILDLN